jgi:hypothetical protein
MGGGKGAGGGLRVEGPEEGEDTGGGRTPNPSDQGLRNVVGRSLGFRSLEDYCVFDCLGDLSSFVGCDDFVSIS